MVRAAAPRSGGSETHHHPGSSALRAPLPRPSPACGGSRDAPPGPRTPPGRAQTGMSLIEVLAAVVLLAAVLVVAVPQLRVPDTVNASTVAHQIAADLHLARQLAIAYRVNYALEFSPTTAPYTAYTVRNAATLAEEPDFPKAIPSEVVVSGGGTVTFTPDGCVDDDGLGTRCAGTDRVVTVTGGGTTATVQVYWYAGRIKVVGP